MINFEDKIQEVMQEFVVSVNDGSKLRVDIEVNSKGYRITGRFYDVKDCCWYRLEFNPEIVSSAYDSLWGCLEQFNCAMSKRPASIISINSICNATIVSRHDQEGILNGLGVKAEVLVNGN